MFTRAERDAVRDALTAAARTDPDIAAAALTGSTASGDQDDWSDVDLALAVARNADRAEVMARWTERLYGDHGAVHHFDVPAGETPFRVFLLASTLQVDIAFWAADRFGAIGTSFRLLFGATGSPPVMATPAVGSLVGMAWLHALHVRSALARRRPWQAALMLSGMREPLLMLACRRHGLPASHGRGVDRLPDDVKQSFVPSLPASLDAGELHRAFGVLCGVLLVEAAQVDGALAQRLAGPVKELVRG